MTCPICQANLEPNAAHCRACGATLHTPPPSSVVKDDLEPGTELHGRYRILERLGRGGFGITYRAYDSREKAYVAVKELFPEGAATRVGMHVHAADKHEFERLRARMAVEADTLKHLTHKSATRMLEFFETNGTAYLVMEFFGGETLEHRIQRGHRLQNTEARAILFTVLEVLAQLHGLGLLHRDIKPGNIMLNRDGQGGEKVELIDFGSAVRFRLGERIRRERLLTPMYAPLEQYGEQVALAPGTDFYALGATLYHALTLQPPPSALERAKGKDLTPVRDLVPAVDFGVARFIGTCLEMKLEHRPKDVSSALELMHNGELQPHVANANATTQHGGTPYSLRDWLSFAVFGFILVSLLFSGVSFLLSR
jgi:serine/threonine-protein kinase